jgi:hypothetical protein
MSIKTVIVEGVMVVEGVMSIKTVYNVDSRGRNVYQNGR